MRKPMLVGAFAILIAGLALAQGANPSTHVMTTAGQLKWGDPPPVFEKGAQFTVVSGDPGQPGLYVVRLKMPAGYKIPPHFHKASENVTVLTGVFYIGLGEKFDQGTGQELPVGGFVSVPPKHAHYAWAGREETVVQVHGVGPTDLTFVNPADDPRKK